MKDSGIEWIGEIPQAWSVTKTKGVFYRKKDKSFKDNPTILSLARAGVKVRDISTNEGQLASDYSQYNSVEPGDFLLNPMDLYSGANCNVSNVYGVISPAYFNLRVRKESNNSKYFDYYFKTQYWSMAMFAHGTGVSHDHRWTINTETLMNYYIPVATQQEQDKVVKFLDIKVNEIDSLIDRTQATIADYKLLKQSIITEAVTKGLDKNVDMKESSIERIEAVPSHWEINKMKNIATLAPKCKNSHLSNDSDVAFAPMETIKNGYYIPRITKFSNINSSYNSFENGDIVIAKVTPCFENGNITVMDKLPNSFGFGSSELFVLRPNNNVYKEFLFYYLQNSHFINGGISTMTGTGGLKRVSSYFMRNHFMYLPPRDEQKQIAKFLDDKISKIEKLVNNKEQLLNDLETFKKSLIYEYVTGKREVK